MEGEAVERGADRPPGGGRWSGNIARPAGRLFRGRAGRPAQPAGVPERLCLTGTRTPRRRTPGGGSARTALGIRPRRARAAATPSGTRGSRRRWPAGRRLRSATDFAGAREAVASNRLSERMNSFSARIRSAPPDPKLASMSARSGPRKRSTVPTLPNTAFLFTPAGSVASSGVSRTTGHPGYAGFSTRLLVHAETVEDESVNENGGPLQFVALRILSGQGHFPRGFDPELTRQGIRDPKATPAGCEPRRDTV